MSANNEGQLYFKVDLCFLFTYTSVADFKGYCCSVLPVRAVDSFMTASLVVVVAVVVGRLS
jgi:hypothetical protein